MSEKEKDLQLEHPEPAIHSDNEKSAVPSVPEDKRGNPSKSSEAEKAEPPVG